MNMRPSILVSLFGVALIALLAGCAPTPGSAPTAAEAVNTLSVRGVGEASAAPDLVYVSLGFFARGADVRTAVEESNQVLVATMQALAGMGVAEQDMQTADFNVWSEEQFEPFTVGEPGEGPQVVYRVENSLRVTVRDVARVSDVIQAGLEAGANQVRGLQFTIEDTGELERQARALAIEDARARADDLAQLMGVAVGDPVLISEGFVEGAFPVAEAAFGLGGGPPISGGLVTVRVQVNVSFSFDG